MHGTGDRKLTDLLAASNQGDIGARGELITLIHDEISRIGSFILRRESAGISIVTGDLVNEATVRLLQSSAIAANDKSHFLALSARVMRNVLIDAARKKNADKRRRISVTFTGDAIDAAAFECELQSLEAALIRLKVIDPERAEIVIMRYYGGMTNEEVAAELGVSESKVKRSWRVARAWLKETIINDPVEP
ncbi:MAG: ECF-type sigma factor [Pseudomonadota bacterium]